MAVGTIATAANWNILANDLTFLAGTAAATVAGTNTTGSTAFVTLGGPQVTLVTGTRALVFLSATISNTAVSDGALMGFSASTGSGTTPNAVRSLRVVNGHLTVVLTTNYVPGSMGNSRMIYVSTMTPGSNTFAAKYAAITAGTASFSNRQIAVIPLP